MPWLFMLSSEACLTLNQGILKTFSPQVLIIQLLQLAVAVGYAAFMNDNLTHTNCLINILVHIKLARGVYLLC